jgi:hypothetical protein
MVGDVVSKVKKLIGRLRFKLSDTDMVSCSQYEIMESINETLRELRKVVTRYYNKLNFEVPPIADVIESSETGWPVEFDDLILDYLQILLLPGDLGTKEQAKMLWQQKVISEASQFDTGIYLLHGYFNKKHKPILKVGDR